MTARERRRTMPIRHGFAVDGAGAALEVVDDWLAADARPPTSPLRADYRLSSCAGTMGLPHHMIARSGADVESRLGETSLYRPDLDLVVLDRRDRVAAYGLFWFDPVTATGLVERCAPKTVSPSLPTPRLPVATPFTEQPAPRTGAPSARRRHRPARRGPRALRHSVNLARRASQRRGRAAAAPHRHATSGVNMAKGYWIVRVDIADLERYKIYTTANAKPFAKYGARFLARGGKFENPEGSARARNAVIEFPTYEAAVACWHSPEYQEVMKIRQPISTADLVIIEGYDGPQPA